MNAMLSSSSEWGRTVGSFGFDLVVRSSVLILLAFALHALLGRRRVLIRSVVWNATLVGLLLLPVAMIRFPRILLALRAAPPTSLSVDTVKEKIAFDDALVTHAPLPPTAFRTEPSAIKSTPLSAKPVDLRPSMMPRVGAAEVFLCGYALVALGLLTRLGGSLLAVRRLKRSCDAVTEGIWHNALENWRRTLGISRSVRLGRTSSVGVPMVVGWFRPMVVIPEKMMTSSSQKAVDAVLIHELAHVQRGDYAWNLARKIVQIAYWPHPLSWLLGPVFASVREQACDELCVHWMGGIEDYRATLLEVASSLVRRPDTALGMAMTRSTRLRRRLTFLTATPGRSRCVLRGPARITIAAVSLAAVVVLGSVQVAREAAAQVVSPVKDDKDSAKSLKSANKPVAIAIAAPVDEKKAASEEGSAQPSSDTSGAVQVTVVKPKVEEWPIQISEVTMLRPIESVEVVPESQGVLMSEGLARVGDRVKKGQVLGVFEDRDLLDQIGAARIKAKRAESRWKQSQAELKVAELTTEEKSEEARRASQARQAAESQLASTKKAREVLKEARESTKEAPAEKEDDLKRRALEEGLKNAESLFATAVVAERAASLEKAKAMASLEVAKAEVKNYEISWEEAQRGLSKLPSRAEIRPESARVPVVSPMDGILLARNITPGQGVVRVMGGEGSHFVVARTDVLLADISVPEASALFVAGDCKVTFRLKSQPERNINGKIHQISTVVDDEKLQVQVEIPNSDGKLRPGMSGIASVVLPTPRKVLTMPYQAMWFSQPGSRNDCLRVVNGKTAHTFVKLGAVSRGRVEILEGLVEGDSVITYRLREGRLLIPSVGSFAPGNGLDSLGHGVPVEVIDTPQPSPDERWDFYGTPQHENGNVGFGGGASAGFF